MSDELMHYGILGMRWGIRRTPEQLGHKIRKTNKKLLKYEQKQLEIQKKALENKKRDLKEGATSNEELSKLDTKSLKYQKKVVRGKKKLMRLEEALAISEILERVSGEAGMSREELMKTDPDRFYDALKHADDESSILEYLSEHFTPAQQDLIYVMIDDLIEDVSDNSP